MTWCPMTMVRPDGSAYSLFVFFQQERGEGFEATRFQAEQQNEDGTAYRFAAVDQDLHFEDGNRRLTHGTITLTETDGSTRPLTITAAGPTGFHLGTAGYYGWNDWVYGQWVGELKVEGTTSRTATSPRSPARYTSCGTCWCGWKIPPAGVGLGNAETFALGAFPERGLSAENSFL